MPYKHKAGGSNPSSPTTNSKISSNGGLFRFRGGFPGFEPREGLPNRLEDHLVGKTAPMCKILLFGVGRSSKSTTTEQRDITPKVGDLGFCKYGAAMRSLEAGKCELFAYFTYPEREYFAHSPKIFDKMLSSSPQERRRNDIFELAHSWESQLLRVGIKEIALWVARGVGA